MENSFTSNAQRRLRLFLLLAVLALAPRLLLCSVNRWANDYHLSMLDWLREHHRLPLAGDCWMCFQALAYHFTVGALLGFFGPLPLPTRIMLAQTLNVFVGVLTLIVVWRALRDWSGLAGRNLLVAFAFAALSPPLVLVNVQASNDTFAIFGASVAITELIRWLQTRRPLSLALMLLGALVAPISKGTSLAAIVCLPLLCLAVVLCRGMRDSRRDTIPLVVAAGMLIGIVLPLAAILGPYYRHYRAYGNPFVINVSPEVTKRPAMPPPELIRLTSPPYPGIRSVVDGFLTFRYIDLLTSPESPREQAPFPEHRTSHWTRIFALSHSLTFDRWPRAWEYETPAVHLLRRASFLLGLVPALLCVTGIVGSLPVLYSPLSKRKLSELDWPMLVAIPVVVATAAMQAYFAYSARNFEASRATYHLPAFVPLILLFARGYGRLAEKSPQRAIFLSCTLTLLCVCYAIDCGTLVLHLWNSNYRIPF